MVYFVVFNYVFFLNVPRSYLYLWLMKQQKWFHRSNDGSFVRAFVGFFVIMMTNLKLAAHSRIFFTCRCRRPVKGSSSFNFWSNIRKLLFHLEQEIQESAATMSTGSAGGSHSLVRQVITEWVI